MHQLASTCVTPSCRLLRGFGSVDSCRFTLFVLVSCVRPYIPTQAPNIVDSLNRNLIVGISFVEDVLNCLVSGFSSFSAEMTGQSAVTYFSAFI